MNPQWFHILSKLIVCSVYGQMTLNKRCKRTHKNCILVHSLNDHVSPINSHYHAFLIGNPVYIHPSRWESRLFSLSLISKFQPKICLFPHWMARSYSSSSTAKPSRKRNKHKSKEMEGNQETDSLNSMEILFDKLNAIESRMEDNFSNLHSQIAVLTCEFKQEINVVKSTLN